MKYIISLFWGFTFAFISIFIITSILGNNGISKGITINNILILSLAFTLGVILLESVVKMDKK